MGLKEHPRGAKKSLGQNFLLDPNLAQKIVSCLEIQPEEKVLEIGPGQGALTKYLLSSPARVLAVEKDLYLALKLKKCYPYLDLIAADVLKMDWSRVDFAGIDKVIGNLPYNIASALIWDMVRVCSGITRMVFTVQKEVAQRLTAAPGNRVYGALAVWVRNFASIKYEFTLGPQVFKPRPKVHSAVISISPCVARMDNILAAALSELIHDCFQQRRKQLKNLLKRYAACDIEHKLLCLGLMPTCRPEELSPEQFLDLARFLVQKKCLPRHEI